MTDDDDVPIYPVLGYGTGTTDEAVVVSLELATDLEEYETREGSWISVALSADNALAFGQELIALAEQAKAGKRVN